MSKFRGVGSGDSLVLAAVTFLDWCGISLEQFFCKQFRDSRAQALWPHAAFCCTA
jgi:hypothetical protein